MSKWAKPENESDYKLSEESAEKAVRELLDFYEVDVERAVINPEHEKAVDGQLDELMNAYRRGDMENNKDDNLGFCVIQHLKNGSTLTYREMGGKDRVVMEGFDETRNISRIYAILGKLCGYGEDAIMKLKGQDWKNARALALVFQIASVG